jgi:hypothetical protein
MLADGIVREWPFTFRAWEGQVAVIVTNPQGRETDVTEQAHIAVRQNEPGGVALYPASPETPALATGWKLTVTRNMNFLQHTDLVTGSRYQSEVIEDRFDRLTAQDQELFEGLDRAVKVGIGCDKTPEEFVESIFKAADIVDENLQRVVELLQQIIDIRENLMSFVMEANENTLSQAAELAGSSCACADTACSCAADAARSAEEARRIAVNIPGIVQNLSAFFGIKIEGFEMTIDKFEGGEPVHLDAYDGWFVLPTQSRLYRENGELILELPITAQGGA